ncbi:tyrosine--tRNA ligase [Corynebacterium sp. CCM 8835]|uniref:Tyrosine--tRNA ligase n=1 Tax=Corynebacterium antarcticum TaxID=2800405 RepID=A0A9Q4GNM0_9CORY|nr:tyrosine--tRNA ligase [Corynebacterium antarcticum]MCK7643147.1 tyrosine--tRNA ligase [Corynebacterium antarcticum]MCK7661650.1 tyrosine--tRNA ligase [Corynebacterium antarcticum]MCL0246393.1 tyrosine--tRNA ligase [Corynebacterium antarcticum]MCX7493136.1 tyrosine--tRNA ligase [Corynebacterium antarcticum]MCX7538976.1 tyrosine--tRNA ligase [Corynebacterium antarcticum]
MTMNIIDELSWRGLINQSTDLDKLREETESPISLYCGFDPTGPSLHAGHLVPLLLLRRFQRAGHRPVALAGGATGMIGDPRDVGERSMLTEETVAGNLERIQKQLARFIDFEGDNAAVMVNNAEWTTNLSVVDFLRDVGKHFSLNTMLNRDTVRRRLDSDGISYTEFSYMLLQANDYVQLNRSHGCVLQIGGGDQWGNIVSGVDLNRRVNGATVHALTVPLVTDSEGNKFGKSTGGGKLWLDPEMTSPYSWYQYFFNTNDADVVKFLRWFTFLDKEELDALEIEVSERPHKREAQRRLAREMTTLVHGADATEAVELAAQALFGRAELADLDERTLEGAVSETTVAEIDADAPRTIVDLLVATGLAESKGAARRSIREGGAYANNVRIPDEEWQPTESDLLHGSWIVLRRGKKNFAGAHFTTPA